MNDLEQRFAGLSPEKRALLQQTAARGRSARARIGRTPRPERIPLTAERLLVGRIPFDEEKHGNVLGIAKEHARCKRRVAIPS